MLQFSKSINNFVSHLNTCLNRNCLRRKISTHLHHSSHLHGVTLRTCHILSLYKSNIFQLIVSHCFHCKQQIVHINTHLSDEIVYSSLFYPVRFSCLSIFKDHDTVLSLLCTFSDKFSAHNCCRSHTI